MLLDDPTIDALAPDVRAIVGEVWLGRARQELGAGATFVILAQALDEHGALPQVRELATRAVADEQRHAALCRDVASRYLGRDLPLPPVLEVEAPRFPGAPPPSVLALHVALICCINETIANAYLDACRLDASAPLARATIRELMRDEVDHARLGWAHMASPAVSDGTRAVLSRWLPTLVEMVREPWMHRAAELPRQIPAGHGCIGGEDMSRVIDGAITDLVLPGFAHVGVG